MTSSKIKKNLFAILMIGILYWNANDQWEQMSLLSPDEKMLPLIYTAAEHKPNGTIPVPGTRQVIFFFSPKSQESIFTAKMLSFSLRLLIKEIKVVAIAQDYSSRDEVDLFYATRLKVPTYFGSSKSLSQYKLFKLPVLYFVNSSGTISGTTLGFTTPIGILFRAYKIQEDKEEYKWWLKF